MAAHGVIGPRLAHIVSSVYHDKESTKYLVVVVAALNNANKYLKYAKIRHNKAIFLANINKQLL